jgi:Tfp pilus assembly protein PilE
MKFKRNNNKGITLVALSITVIVLMILSGITVSTGMSMVKTAKLEELRTNMLLIQAKAKEYVEEANFKLGITIDKLEGEEKQKKIDSAKDKEILKVDEENDITNNNEFTYITKDETGDYIYYYKLTEDNLNDMGISNVKSNGQDGWYIIKYNIKDANVEVYYSKGFQKDGKTYYSLSEIENLSA